MNMNKNVDLRDQILFGTDFIENDYISHGGIKRFSKLSVNGLQALIDNSFIDVNDCQNLAPTVQEFLDFARKYDDYMFHGYAVAPYREDYRVSIEGIEKFTPMSSKEEEKDFLDTFAEADDLYHIGHIYCWFD